jgi:tetratricopeptide (TPR) repeat protein
MPKKLETHYQLALQYAWQRDLDKAILSLSHGLHLNKTHIPSIHLLVLILTALGDYEKALQTCHTITLDNIHDLNVDDAIAMMEMQLTYLRIVEAVSGRDLALEVQKGVFKLYNRLFKTAIAKTPEYVKKTTSTESKANTSDHSLRRVRSDLNTEKQNPNSNSLAPHSNRDSLESKLSLQIPSNRVTRKRSLLKRRTRSRSLNGDSLASNSSAEFSEKDHYLGMTLLLYVLIIESPDVNQTEEKEPEAPLPLPKQEPVSKTPIILQQLPPHASDLPLRSIPSPSEHRQKAAKLYRARLWLACAGIYRRGRQWDGAQAAIKDALLCDVCPEEVFTEV